MASDEAHYTKLLNLGNTKASSRKTACTDERRQQEMQEIRNSACQWVSEQIKMEAQKMGWKSAEGKPRSLHISTGLYGARRYI